MVYRTSSQHRLFKTFGVSLLILPASVEVGLGVKQLPRTGRGPRRETGTDLARTFCRDLCDVDMMERTRWLS